MAKKKKSKSQAVREYLAENPKAAVADIAKSLKVSPAIVYNVKSLLKGKASGATRGKVGRPKGTVAARRGKLSNTSPQLSNVIEAARLIQSCGGIDHAKQALDAAEQVAVTMQD